MFGVGVVVGRVREAFFPSMGRHVLGLSHLKLGRGEGCPTTRLPAQDWCIVPSGTAMSGSIEYVVVI